MRRLFVTLCFAAVGLALGLMCGPSETSPRIQETPSPSVSPIDRQLERFADKRFRRTWPTLSERAWKKLLIAKWVAHDAEDALDFALALQEPDRGFFLTELYFTEPEVVFSRLTEVFSRDYHFKRQFRLWLTKAAQGDRARMIELTEAFPLIDKHPNFMAFADPRRAIEEAHAIDDRSSRIRRTRAAYLNWYEIDPEAAWSHAHAHLPSSLWDDFSFSMFDDWVRKDPRAAYAHIRELPVISESASYWYELIGRFWPIDDFESVLKVAKEAPKSLARQDFLSMTIQRGAIQSIDDGFRILAIECPWARPLILRRIAELMHKQDGLERVESWAATLEPNERAEVLALLPGRLIDDEATLAQLPDLGANTPWIEETVRRLANAPGALGERLLQIPEGQRYNAYEILTRELGPSEALALGDRYFTNQDSEWRSHRRHLLTDWAKAKPEDSVLWMAAVPEGKNGRSMRGELLSIWISTNDTAAERWARGQEDPEILDQYLYQRIHREEYEPSLHSEDAYALAEQISDERLRSASIEKVMRRWMVLDGEAAAERLPNLPVSPSRRNMIMKDFEQREMLTKLLSKIAP